MKKANFLLLLIIFAAFSVGIMAQDSQAIFDRGLDQFKSKQFEDAIQSFKQYLAMVPNDSGAFYNIALSYDRLGRSDDAVSYFKEAIRVKPDYAPAFYSMGNVYYGSKRYGDAA